MHNLQKFLGLLVIMTLTIITRGHYNWLDSLIHLPDFTLPALFIIGVYYREWFYAALLVILAVAIDNYAIVHQGVSANCITPAYSILIISYFLVYLAGKKLSALAVNSFVQLLGITLLSIITFVVQWLIATTSYYAFTTSSWGHFLAYIMQWSVIEIPPILSWMIFVVIAFTLQMRYKILPVFHKI